MRIHYRWLLLLLLSLSLSSSSSDRQAKSLIPRTQHCSAFEHSSFGAATSCSKGADREGPGKTSGGKPTRSRRTPSKPSDVTYHHTNPTPKTGGPEVTPGNIPGPKNRQKRCRRAPEFSSERPRAGGSVRSLLSWSPGGKENFGQRFRRLAGSHVHRRT